MLKAYTKRMPAIAAKAISSPNIPPFIREIRQITIAKTAAIGITISANIAFPFLNNGDLLTNTVD